MRFSDFSRRLPSGCKPGRLQAGLAGPYFYRLLLAQQQISLSQEKLLIVLQNR